MGENLLKCPKMCSKTRMYHFANKSVGVLVKLYYSDSKEKFKIIKY